MTTDYDMTKLDSVKNLATVRRSSYQTWLVTLNGRRVAESANNVKANAIADWLNHGRAYGFDLEVVKHVIQFQK